MRMFAVTPYEAEREIFNSRDDGGMSSRWEPCRVIGITKDEDGEPAYLVEHRPGSEFMLAVEPYIRKCEPRPA